jgi:hypothetical protein
MAKKVITWLVWGAVLISLWAGVQAHLRRGAQCTAPSCAGSAYWESPLLR